MTCSLRAALAAVVLLTLAACTSTAAAVPDPTPQIVKVEVPGPQPTPQIVTKFQTNYVTPEACTKALDSSELMVTHWSAWLDAMATEKWSKAEKLSEKVSDDLGAYYGFAEQCRGFDASSD